MTTHADTSSSSSSTPTKPKREKIAMNGVDVPTLFATLGAVKEQPVLADFRFRASNRWISGTHSRTTAGTFTGAGGDHEHLDTFTYDGDHPTVLTGTGKAPTPVEYLLHALAACITAGIGNIASARGIKLTSVESTIEGDIDLQGILGLSDQVRNGFKQVRISFKIEGDATPEQLQAVVEQSQARSAVYDVLTNGIPVDVEIHAA